MSKKSLIVLGALLVIVAAVVFTTCKPGTETKTETKPGTDSVTEPETNGTPETQPNTETETETVSEPGKNEPDEAPDMVRDSVPPPAFERVKSRKNRGQFAISGRGEDKDWGISQVMNFQYTATVVASSEILSKKTLPSGYIKIEEKRTFESVTDSLVVSDYDIKLALDTLPLDTFIQVIDVLTKVYSTATGDPISGMIFNESVDFSVNQIKNFDGTSLRNVLGFVGIKNLPDSVEKYLNNLAGSKVHKALGGVRAISGKSYLIKWFQSESGTPMMVTFSNIDGTKVTDEEELMILRRINTFMDYNIIPNRENQPGSKWTILAKNMQEVFDPFVDGEYSGEIEVTRKENDENGNWFLAMSPSQISIVSASGDTTGELNLENGYGKVSPKDVSVNELFAEGSARLEKLTQHHWLFNARIEGACDFQGRLVSEEIKETVSTLEDASDQ